MESDVLNRIHLIDERIRQLQADKKRIKLLLKSKQRSKNVKLITFRIFSYRISISRWKQQDSGADVKLERVKPISSSSELSME